LAIKFVDISSGKQPALRLPGRRNCPQKFAGLAETLDIGQFKERLKVVSALLDDIEQGAAIWDSSFRATDV